MPKSSVFRSRVGTELVMGKVVQVSNIGVDRIPCAQVRCSLNEFNIYLKKYFARSFDYWALDRESKGSLGDMVMIRRIEGTKRPTAHVAHAIDKVVFKYGNIVDPVTGKRVIKDEFADEIELRKQLVADIVDKPLEQDAMLFEERRAVQQKVLDDKKAAMEDEKPRFLVVNEFVEQRATQIAELLQQVDNTNLVNGEVTKGKRTAAQRLPRHMRRRAMAYEIRRFPKGLREYARAYVANSNHKKKLPSRFFRRRSRNLLLNYIRRQRKMKWLETHIWHAKRFHMVDRWGYRIPDRSFQRAFRPIYRASVRHCSVRDKSYLHCFQISHRNQEELIHLLSPICSSSASPTFAFKSALQGQYETCAFVYRAGQYPNGFIGPIRFLWSRKNALHSLSLWVHPSCSRLLLDELTKVLSLKKLETSAGGLEHKKDVPKTVEEWRLRRMDLHTDIYEGPDGLTLTDLTDQMTRIRLCGPLSMQVAAGCMKVVAEQDSYRKNHSEWETISRVPGGQLQDGSVFSLLVEDPRISRLERPQVPNVVFPAIDELNDSPCIPQADIWDRKLRLNALQTRLTDSELNKLKGATVGSVQSTPTKIPVLVIVRESGSGRSDALSGVDIVAPGGFGCDFWIACQLRTARASGRKDELAAHLEGRRLDFPSDSMGSEAGKLEQQRQRKDLEEKYLRKPHNRRVIFWNDMSIKHPFSFEMQELVNDWLSSKKRISTKCEEYYVLQDRRARRSIANWLLGRAKRPDEVFKQNESAVVAVEMECIARGRPRRFGIVCLPTAEDLHKVRRIQHDGPVIVIQPKRSGETTEIEKCTDGTETLAVTNNDATFWKDVVSLDVSTREKPISLKNLFPETNNLNRGAKRRALNRAKKEKRKRRRLETSARLAASNAVEEDRCTTSYRQAANRLTIGRIVRGDFCFSATKGRALGFVPLVTLDEVKASGGIVLLRNSTSKYYHPARLRIMEGITTMV